MKTILRPGLLVLLVFGLLAHASATWSIIMVDPKTNEIGIAGASCTYSVYGIGAIVPAKGAIVVQAMSNPLARRKGVQMIMANAGADEIMNALKDPEFEPDEQQYAVITVQQLDKPLTYTGATNPAVKGAATAKGISVQGNTLANPKAIDAILEVAVKAQNAGLQIQDVLMLALETGARFGGDKRCGDTKASSAFLTIAKPGDNARSPFLNLVVNGSNEKVNAVEALRKKFNDWKGEQKGN